MEEIYYIAAYGTLRADGDNHHIICPHDRPEISSCLGQFWINGWQMYDNFIYPYAARGSEVDRILVELWAIPAELLPEVDKLEGYPDYYQRTELDFTLPDNRQIKAYLYFVGNNTVAGLSRVASGDWFNR